MTPLPAALLTATWAWYGRNTPRAHPRVTAAELAELDTDESAEPTPLTLARMRGIFADRDVRLLTFSYFCFNFVFYLLGTWSFLYLVQQRRFTGLESGFAGMMPWIGAGIGALSGAGHWSAAFVIGAAFAVVAAACWLAIDPDPPVPLAARAPLPLTAGEVGQQAG